MAFKTKQKIKFKEDWDIFPHALVKKGELGTIKKIDKSGMWIKLKKNHKGLDTWENQAHLGFDERKPIDYIKNLK